MSTNSTGPILVGGIPIVWVVVLACGLIVIGVCALSYPLILINRWRLKERVKSENDDGEEEEEEEEPVRRKKGGQKGIFGRGRPSTRGKWVERTDPQSGQPYYEHTGTGEVTWTDPRPQKMRGKQVANSLVVASMAQPMMANNYAPQMPAQGYGAPGGFGGPRPGLPSHGSMGMMPANPIMHSAGSMGNVMPPQMQSLPRMPAGQPFPGPMGMPPQGMPQGMPQGIPHGMPPNIPHGMPPMPSPSAAPPGMASAGSIRRTQAPAAPAQAAPAPAAPAADPKFDKYVRMQKAGLPEGAVRNAMVRDNVSDADQKIFLGS